MTLQNVNINSTSYNVGGIVGHSKEITIENCSVYGKVRATGGSSNSSSVLRTNLGGILGCGAYNGYNTIENCKNYAQIEGSNYNVGGVVGWLCKGKINNCVNYGKVIIEGSSAGCCGGITGEVGRNYSSSVNGSGEISNSVNYGEIICNGFETGGIAGAITYSSSISYCVNYGSVTTYGKTSSYSYTGGIVGVAFDSGTNKILYSYNRGKVTGSYKRVGGIAGSLNSSKCSITSCYNTGEVSGESYVGGIRGYSKGTVSDSYYLKGVVLTTSTDETLETDENTLKGLSQQDGWKDYFVEDKENKNDGYPILYWQ